MFLRIFALFTMITAATVTQLAAQDAASSPDKQPADTPADPPAEKTPAAPDSDEQPADADQLFQDGRKALFQGKYDDAIKHLRAAVAADPSGTKTVYRLHLARAYRYSNQPKESETLLREILTRSPDHVEAGQLLAEILYSQDRWEDIAKLLKPLLKFRHDYPTYHMLAEAMFNLDQYEDARKYYKEAIRLNSSSAPDHYQLANIYLADNRFALAADGYETALRLGLDSSVLHYKLASAYFNLRNYFGRVAVVTVASGQPGKINKDWYLIERVPGEKDVFRAAPRRSAIFQISAAINGGMEDRVDIQMLLANIYLNARRYQQAYGMYESLGEKVPKEEQALYRYFFAQSALGVGKLDEYLQHLKEAVRLDGDAYASALVDAYITVADKNNQAGKLDKYIEYLVLAVEQTPQTASLHLKLAAAFEESRQFDKAVQQWRMVLDLEPDHPKRTELINLIKRHRDA